MSLTLYDITIPPFLHSLSNLSLILRKAETHAHANSIPASTYLTARLAPDMEALPFQIQRVSDTARGVTVRLADQPPVPMADTESTFEELQARIQKTIEVLKGVERKKMDGQEGKEVVVRSGAGEWKFTGKGYVTDYVIMNFYFHLSMAYAILRNKGVKVGKLDYLGAGVGTSHS